MPCILLRLQARSLTKRQFVPLKVSPYLTTMGEVAVEKYVAEFVGTFLLVFTVGCKYGKRKIC